MGGGQLNCKAGSSRVAIAFSSSKCAVLIHAEIGLQTMDGICDSVTLVLQLLSYWKHWKHLIPTEPEVSLHAFQASVGRAFPGQGVT